MVNAVRVGSAVGVAVDGTMGEREMFARACWKIVVLQVQAGRCEKLLDGRWAWRAENYITSCCWFSWIDLIDSRISASSGMGALVETAKSLAQAF